jgi:hypothetical protein
VTNPLKNISASVREKLRNIARQRNADFGLILVKYGLERILFRLSRSAYHDVFVLKGALLFELWTGQQYRPTRDADFLARGENSPKRFVRIFRELCSVETEPDGLRFDPDTVTAERITEDADYEGVRVSFTAYLERAKSRFRSISVLEMLSRHLRSKTTIPHCSDQQLLVCSPILGRRLSPKNWKRWSSWGLPTAE